MLNQSISQPCRFSLLLVFTWILLEFAGSDCIVATGYVDDCQCIRLAAVWVGKKSFEWSLVPCYWRKDQTTWVNWAVFSKVYFGFFDHPTFWRILGGSCWESWCLASTTVGEPLVLATCRWFSGLPLSFHWGWKLQVVSTQTWWSHHPSFFLFYFDFVCVLSQVYAPNWITHLMAEMEQYFKFHDHIMRPFLMGCNAQILVTQSIWARVWLWMQLHIIWTTAYTRCKFSSTRPAQVKLEEALQRPEESLDWQKFAKMDIFAYTFDRVLDFLHPSFLGLDCLHKCHPQCRLLPKMQPPKCSILC